MLERGVIVWAQGSMPPVLYHTGATADQEVRLLDLPDSLPSASRGLCRLQVPDLLPTWELAILESGCLRTRRAASSSMS